MKGSQLVLTFVLVSFILSLPTGCQHQSATAPDADQKAESPAKANQAPKPVAKDSKSTINNRKSQIKKPSPRISFEKTVHNFGEVGIREKGGCEFKFKNTGQALLKIRKIRSTCGCTVPSLSKTEYEPGEEGVIKVKYSGQSKPGCKTKRKDK